MSLWLWGKHSCLSVGSAGFDPRRKLLFFDDIVFKSCRMKFTNQFFIIYSLWLGTCLMKSWWQDFLKYYFTKYSSKSSSIRYLLLHRVIHRVKAITYFYTEFYTGLWYAILHRFLHRFVIPRHGIKWLYYTKFWICSHFLSWYD